MKLYFVNLFSRMDPNCKDFMVMTAKISTYIVSSPSLDIGPAEYVGGNIY